MIRSIGYDLTQLILKLWTGKATPIPKGLVVDAVKKRRAQNGIVFSGPFLVSRTGDVGWTKRRVKMHTYRLMKIPKRVLIFWDSREVVMEVEIL
jgi:hypothetical protein